MGLTSAGVNFRPPLGQFLPNQAARSPFLAFVAPIAEVHSPISLATLLSFVVGPTTTEECLCAEALSSEVSLALSNRHDLSLAQSEYRVWWAYR